MGKYVLFFNGIFIDEEDIETHMSQCFNIDIGFENIRFILESDRSGLVLFETDEKKEEINKRLYENLSTDSINSYYVFELDKMLSTYISPAVRDFIYTSNDSENNLLKFDETPINKIPINKKNEKLDLDTILEKIDSFGIESLSTIEKNFLDNFRNIV